MNDLNKKSIPSEVGHYRLSLREIGRLLALLLTFSTTLIFLGVWSFTAEGRQMVRVGIFQNQPIVFQDEQNVPQGIYVDLLRKIAQEEDWEIEFVAGSWAEGLERLSTGEIDLMTSIAYTEERDAHMDFSKENVLMMWGKVYVKPDLGIQNILDLKGQKVAILKDGINGINFRKLCSAFDVNCQFVIVDSYARVFELVSEGEVIAGVVNNVHGDMLVLEYGLQQSPILFNPFSLLFSVPEGEHKELLSVIDKHLADWKRDESSFYYETLDRWFGGGKIRKHRIPRWAIFSLAISGGLLLFFFTWMYILRMQVKARTKEIKLNEEKLRASNQQLQASEQQMKTSNQQLGASEQQLKASNQQLQASEQQLKTSNQQLQASEQQMKASNQQLRANEQQLHVEITERKEMEEERKEHVHELEVFYKASIAREEKVLELKKRIRELEENK